MSTIIPGEVFKKVKLAFLASAFKNGSAGEGVCAFVCHCLESKHPEVGELIDTDKLVGLLRDYQYSLRTGSDEADEMLELYRTLLDTKRSAEFLLDHERLPFDCNPENPGEEPWKVELWRAFQRLRPDVEPTAPRDKPCLPDAFLAAMSGTPCGKLERTDRVEFHEFPSPHVEIRVAARKVATMLAGKAPISPQDILLVIPDAPAYAAQLGRELDNLGIPHDLPAFANLAETPCGQFLMRLLAIARKTRPEWRDIAGLVVSPFVSRGALFGEGKTSARQFIENLGRFNLHSGTWAEWQGAVKRAMDYQDGLAKLADKDEDGDSASSSRAQDAFRMLTDFSPAFDSCVSLLRKAFSCSGGKQSSAAWAGWLLAALNSLGTAQKLRALNANEPTEDAAGTSNLEVFQAARGILKSMSRGNPGAGELSVGDFGDLLKEALGFRAFAAERRFAKTVSVRRIHELEHRSWPHVLVLGMNEGGIPQAPKPLPLIDENAMAALGLETLERQNQRLEEAALYALGAAAETLLLSYSSTAPDGGATLPSALLQRLDDALAPRGARLRRTKYIPAETDCWGVRHSESELLPLDARSVVTGADALVHNRLNGVLDDTPDAVLTRCWFDSDNWQERPGDPDESEFLNFGSVPPDKLILKPSMLDKFGACPYQYFANGVLGLEEPQEIEPTPDAMVIGTAVHAALEKTVRQLVEENTRFCDTAAFQRNAKKYRELLGQNLDASFKTIISEAMGYSESVVDSLCRKWAIMLRGFAKELFRMDLRELRDKDGDSYVETIEAKCDYNPAKNNKGDIPKREAEALLKRLLAGELPEVAEWPKNFKNLFKPLVEYHRKWLQDFEPRLCEWRFGSSKEPFVLDIDGVELRVSGQIDRIDLGKDADGVAVLRVMDYKSAKAQKLSDKAPKGIKLQVPLYAVVLDAAVTSGRLPNGLPGGKLAAAGVYALKEDAPEETLKDAALDLDLMRRWILAAHQHIAAGRLAPSPKDDCPDYDRNGYCKLSRLCRVGTLCATPRVGREKYQDLRPADASVAPQSENGGNE